MLHAVLQLTTKRQALLQREKLYYNATSCITTGHEAQALLQLVTKRQV